MTTWAKMNKQQREEHQRRIDLVAGPRDAHDKGCSCEGTDLRCSCRRFVEGDNGICIKCGHEQLCHGQMP